MNKNKDTIPKEKVALPDGVTLDLLDSNFKVATTEYGKVAERLKKLDLADKNRLWEAIAAKFPKYQVLPETNHVSYIKNNILASIYTVGKSAKLLPTSEHDKDIVETLNSFLDYIWSELRISRYQMLAGERAALLNLGVTQVGWDNSFSTGSGDRYQKGRCQLKNVNPLRYMRDPFAEDLDTASYVMVWDYYHKSVILANPNYRKPFKQYLDGLKNGGTFSSGGTVEQSTDRASSTPSGRQGYYKIITHWVRVEDQIHEIHTLDNTDVLYVKPNIKPSRFPFVELYCNLPSNDLFGVSEPNKVFANSIAYNIMNSILLTSEYKNQRPPRFVNTQAGLNIPAFIKHGNDADKVFPVNGDASKAVHYHQFPTPSPSTFSVLGVLSNDIQNITGVDGRYTGRDTGSILTTGGVNSMLDQVTMIDAPKIENYEDYSKRLTELILAHYIEFSAVKRNYIVRVEGSKNKWKSVEVDFDKVPADAIFGYELAISSELPKNKTSIANMANKMMEMQMQYSSQNIDADLITPQEWLMFQDLPMKEYMLERMGVQRTSNWTEIVAQVVSQYAGMVQQGADPEEAILATADTMQAQTSNMGGASAVADTLASGGMLGGIM